MAAKETFIGTPDECIEQIRALAAVVPIDPILVRAQWPHMTSDQVVAYLDDLGRDIVPAVREIESVDRVVREAAARPHAHLNCLFRRKGAPPGSSPERHRGLGDHPGGEQFVDRGVVVAAVGEDLAGVRAGPDRRRGHRRRAAG